MARVAPFVAFLALTFCQGQFGAASAYWFYFVKTLVGVWLIWEMRPLVPEMRWAMSWEAVGVGMGVFVLWVGLDPFYPKLTGIIAKTGLSKFFGTGQLMWDPHTQFGGNSALAWLMIMTRILGSTLVVPPLEEVFYRSFLYRYIAKPDFLSVPLNRFLPLPFFAAAAVFGLSHSQWLAGILCGMAYQWLVLHKNRLGDAMTAHAITNFLLGVWVVWKPAWQFW
jgi:CAAX protease family protein